LEEQALLTQSGVSDVAQAIEYCEQLAEFQNFGAIIGWR
jgi:hypothetical protein